MSNTYSQLHIQFIIAVKGRQNLLHKNWREKVFKYIAKIIKDRGHKSIIVNGIEDHVHIFVGLNPSMSISDLVRDIKSNSSRFINQQQWIRGKFAWQSGYGAFSYSRSQIEDVYNYILRQEEHHKKQSFKEEYYTFLKKFEVEYQDQYLFDWILE